MDKVLMQLRRAMNGGKWTRAELSRETGIAESVLSRFAAGTVGLSFETAGKLAAALGLAITIGPRRKGR